MSLHRRDRQGLVIAAVVLVFSVLALGSAPRWATCVTSLLVLVSALPFVGSRRTIDRLPPLVLFFVFAAAVTALQWIPLPALLTELLSPAKYELAGANAAALGDKPPRVVPLTYDAAVTLVELVKLGAYAIFACVCVRLAASTSGRRGLAAIVATTGTLVAVIGILHYLVGADRLFGIYQPRRAPQFFLAPLLNANHLAGFLSFTVPISLALAVQARGSWRLAWLGSALLCMGAALVSQSRGATVALVAGLIFTGGLFLLQRTGGSRVRAASLSLGVVVPAAVIALCVLVLLGAFTAGGVARELAGSEKELRDPGSKLRAWGSSAELIRDHPWTGVGRGGFEPAFTRVHPSHDVLFSHLENEYLQAVVDWGIPAAAALALMLVGFFIAATRRWALDPLQAGALGALILIGLHNFVDFNLEMQGVALSAIAIAAVCVPATMTAFTSSRLRPLLIRRGGALVSGLVLLVAAGSPLGRNARGDEAILRQALTNNWPSTPDAAAALGADLFAKHPSDHVIAGLTAQAFLLAGDPRAVRVVNRALALNPSHAGLHHLAAQILIRSPRRDQALVEYALALEAAAKRSLREAQPILEDLLRQFPDSDLAVRGLPATSAVVKPLASLLVTMGRLDVAFAYSQRVAGLAPDDAQAQAVLADMALLSGQLTTAVAAGRRAYALLPSAQMAVILVQALSAAGEGAEVTDVLRGAIERASRRGSTADQLQLLGAQADAFYQLGRYTEAREAVLRVFTFEPQGKEALINAHLRLAGIEEKLGHSHRAEWERKQAKELKERRNVKEAQQRSTR